MPALELSPLEITSPRLPEAFEGLRIVAISDVHFMAETPVCTRLCRVLAHTPADVLVITGDMSARRRSWQRAQGFLGRVLDAASFPMGAFAVLGNHDNWRLRHHWSDGRLRFLQNESCLLPRGDQTLRIAGIEQSEEFGGDLPAALASAGRHPFTLLLAHYPTAALWARYCPVDLILAGHTHGGQICLPGIGPVHTGLQADRTLATGLHRVGDSFLYVSRGIGYSGPFRIRLFCRPQVPLITLRRGRPLAARELVDPAELDADLVERFMRRIG